MEIQRVKTFVKIKNEKQSPKSSTELYAHNRTKIYQVRKEMISTKKMDSGTGLEFVALSVPKVYIT